ncbi:MAG: Gfo/Idh/MocA family oxidoreductase [Planctomycetota bacterium]
MSRLRVAVVGAGHLGRIHAKLLNAVDGAELVAITDPYEGSRAMASEQFGVPTFESHQEIIEQIDAAVIAAPTDHHVEIADDLIQAKKHVLVEKPLATTAADCDRLIAAAQRRRVILQVGHVERFNPAWSAAESVAKTPKYIESVRASSFPGRCLDVGVVMDLMIHDLDLIHSLTDADPVRVDASGISLVSDHEDIAEARVTFGCGLVANVKASRISPSPTRQMQIFGPNGFADIDFSGPSATLIQPDPSLVDRTFDLEAEIAGRPKGPLGYGETLFSDFLPVQTPTIEPRNAILDELHDFVLSVQVGTQPTVNGIAGGRAVALAEQILQSMGQHQWMPADQPFLRGPHTTVPESIEAATRRVHDQRRAA